MYEQNLRPLPSGDFRTIFADMLQSAEQACQPSAPANLALTSVLQFGQQELQPNLAAICRQLLLPGSKAVGTEQLFELTRLATTGHACILCLNHQSNLDVPTLYALLEDQGGTELFQRIIWIAGRKLLEDSGATHVFVHAFNRVIVSPRSWMKHEHSNAEMQLANQINVAAHRAIHDLRHQGWVFALFPTATRVRPHDDATKLAIEETDSYLKHFEFMLLARIDGCTLPVSRDYDLTREVPSRDRVRFTFGTVLATDKWRTNAAGRFPQLDQRAASARAIMEDIMAITT